MKIIKKSAAFLSKTGPTYTNLVTSGTAADENTQPDLSSIYNSCVEMCPSSRFTLHLMKHTHKHFIWGLKVITGFDKYWFKASNLRPSYIKSLWHRRYLFEIRLSIMTLTAKSWKKKFRKTMCTSGAEDSLHFDSCAISSSFHSQSSLSSAERFCWGRLLVAANRINPKNQHILNNCARTSPPPSTSTAPLTQTTTTSRNSAASPSKGTGLFHIYT